MQNLVRKLEHKRQLRRRMSNIIILKYIEEECTRNMKVWTAFVCFATLKKGG
jgi:hypothetical protein